MLELRSRRPARATRKPPLLFVHGGYCDAWCWDRFFLPWFAELGHTAYAVSLRGHGTSSGAEALFLASLDDYVDDVDEAAGGLPAPPILIGHSMGAAVIERMMATRTVRASGLLAPVPPSGLVPVAARLATSTPAFGSHLLGLDPTHLSADVLTALRPFYFSDDVDPAVLAEATRHLNAESARVLFDLSLRLHWTEPQANAPTLVLGAQGDRIATPDDVRATARHHGVEAVIVPGMAHMLMLERQWEVVARGIATWIATLE
ncbi:MAG: alpha/beta fold hydrolase [Burkholderiales bacterium]|nr:alpha/beta fold hydrolase [Burkholderiales bacterium]